MQVSRYIAPCSQQNLISAMLETSTDSVQQEIAAAQQRLQDAAVVLAHQRLDDELDAEVSRLLRAPRPRP